MKTLWGGDMPIWDGLSYGRRPQRCTLLIRDTGNTQFLCKILQGWQGRSGALTSAPRPAPRGKVSAPRPAPRSAPAQVTTPGPSGGRARRGPAELASRAQPSPACSTLRLKSLKK